VATARIPMFNSELAIPAAGMMKMLLCRIKNNGICYAMVLIVFVFCMAQSQYTIANAFVL
jgi:hypothetical protein